jgi:penicillin-binding protein activator
VGKKGILRLLVLPGLVLLFGACASTSTYVRPDSVTEVDATFSDTDLKMMAEKMVMSIAELAIIKHREAPPKLAVMNIENRTYQHIDTEGIVEKIMVALLKTGTVRFVDRSVLKEMAKERNLVENQNIDFDKVTVHQNMTQTVVIQEQKTLELGKAIGADYFLLGGIMSVEKQKGVKDLAYYKLTLRLVDVKTSEIVWADEKEIKKIGKKGFLDW